MIEKRNEIFQEPWAREAVPIGRRSNSSKLHFFSDITFVSPKKKDKDETRRKGEEDENENENDQTLHRGELQVLV